MGVLSQMDRGVRLCDGAPKSYCRGRKDKLPQEREAKADGVYRPEGSNPSHVMASDRETTGVGEQGMTPQG